MKHVQKIIAICLLVALFVPSYANASSGSNSSTCQSVITKAQKDYNAKVKSSDKSFNSTVKAAEKIYKDSIKAGVSKEDAKEVLRNTAWQAFNMRKDTVEGASNSMDSVIENDLITCLKSESSLLSKTRVAKVCSQVVDIYTSNQLKEIGSQSKIFKKTYPNPQEESQFKFDSKSSEKIWKDLRKQSKSLCEDFYEQFFQGEPSPTNPGGNPTVTPNTGDAKRLSDVRQMASALELYYNDHNGYPYSLDVLVPTYISAIPVAPKKSGSKCKASQNTYTYKYLSNSTYTLNFCLGKSISGLKAGPRVMSESGIY